jgi:hypothetical protein
MRREFLILLSILAVFSFTGFGQSPDIRLYGNNELQSFAARQLQNVLLNQGATPGNGSIELKVSHQLPPQAYRISFPAPGSIQVEGGDDLGVMYGGLRLAELIRLNGMGNFDEESSEPYLLRRGLKMDLTLDARTVGYDDSGDSGQKNIPEVWNLEFWTEFLDQMALHQYNAITLWHPHPFPTMLKLEKYPGVAMEDVLRTTRMWPDEVHPRYAPEDVLDHVEVVKLMSIEEKISHWQQIMKHARNRGIEIYFITWNIHLDGANGKHGITPEQDNEQTIQYMHDCVEEFINTYPDLTGLGLTAGEMMEERHDQYSKEKWLWRTYGEGITDALEDEPDRNVRFIHRVWESGMETIMEDFGSKYPGDFEVSFKYAKGRMYSNPNPPFANNLLDELRPYGVNGWWNIRNDDLYTYRWGDPEYARSFIKHIPKEQTAGFHMGSDGYLWIKNFFTRDPEFNGQLEIHKHWYNFMMWGRLGYDPGLDRTFFEARLEERYPEVPSSILYDTWAAVSRIPNQVHQFHWRDWDFQWNYEICSEIYHFHSVEDFIDNPTMEGSGYLTIPEYVESYLKGEMKEGVTPPMVIEELESLVAQTRHGLYRLQQIEIHSNELNYLLMDIESMAHLGSYYAHKISGAMNLAIYRETGDAAYQDLSLSNLVKALASWKKYGDLASQQYIPQRYSRTRYSDWKAIENEVVTDIEIAGRKID